MGEARAYLLGIDLGTTATKCVLCRSDGAIVSVAERPSSVQSASAGFAEMQPEQWWSNVCELIPEVLGSAGAVAGEVAVVGVSGMVPTLVPVDASLVPVHPSIQQNDVRASDEMATMRKAFPDFVKLTGAAVSAQSIGPKWQWLVRHAPEVTDRTACLLGSYGWVIARLTGRRLADANWALESGLCRLGSAAWDDGLLDASGLGAELLPEIEAGNEIAGEVNAVAAAECGLAAGTPVSSGYADHVASAFASGALECGDTLFKLGGSADILVVTSAPIADERLYLDLHPSPGRWLPNGCMATSGAAVRWLQGLFGGGAALAQLDEEAEAAGPGAGGVLALAHLLGEKTPLNDPALRGAFLGLHLGHDRGHLHRALLESVAFGFRHHVEVFDELGIALGTCRVTNGGSRSGLWKQILADVLERPLESVRAHPGSSWGAAMLAAGAIGAADPEELVRGHLQVDVVVEPRRETRERYGAVYDIYREAQRATTPISHALAGLEGS